MLYALLLLLALSPAAAVATECPGSSLYPKEAFVDANCDECYHALDGDRLGVQSSLLGAFVGQPDECLVVPDGVLLRPPKSVTLDWFIDGAVWLRGDVKIPGGEFFSGYLDVEATGDLHVDGKIVVGRNGGIDLRTSPTSVGASIYIGDGAKLISYVSPTFYAEGVLSGNDPSIVIGDRVKIKGKRFSHRAWADANLVVGDFVKVIAVDNQFGGDLDWRANNGAVTIGRKFKVKATGKFFSAQPVPEGKILIHAIGGDLSMGPDASLVTVDPLRLRAEGSVLVEEGARLTVRGDHLNLAVLDIRAGDQVSIEGARFKCRRGEYTAGSLLRLSAVLAASFPSLTSFHTFATTEPGGTCDVTGTVFPQGAIISYGCDNVVGSPGGAFLD